MRIGIDARAAAEVPAGRGRYVRELLSALARREDDHAYALYCRTPERGLGLDGRFRWRTIARPDPAWHVAAAVLASRECDVFLSTNSYLTAWFTRVPTAVTVHDLVAFLPGAKAQKRAMRIERATIRPAIARAARLICDSHATEADLLAHFPKTKGRTSVAQLAAHPRFRPDVDTAAVLKRHGLEQPFVLFAGTLEPRKNLTRLLEAWSRLAPDLRDAHELVLVGPQGWELEALHAPATRALGFVPDDDLAALYRACTAFCFPAVYEGFGLPVLEALQTGAPVITSTVSSLPEVAGDAAEYVDPHDTESIRAALETLLRDPRRRDELSRAGVERARGFSWAKTAEETLAALERAAA